LRLRWAGFRKVRGQVCKRIQRRRRELGLADLAAYRAYLESHTDEWPVLDGLCRITISRFSRDRAVFGFLERDVLPALAAETRKLALWSAGCASGEEPYTLALIWELALAPAFPAVEAGILATDVDPVLVERARHARYAAASLRELPEEWRRRAFDGLELRAEFRRRVRLRQHDLRAGAPDGPFDLVLCRNLAFTYFEPALQEEVCGMLAGCLRPGGALVLGLHESLPAAARGFAPWPGGRGIFVRS
jgi:chemotaxis protein methyltransferase CheR